MAVLRNHCPLLSKMGFGVMQVREILDRPDVFFALNGGFARVSENHVTVLAYDVITFKDKDSETVEVTVAHAHSVVAGQEYIPTQQEAIDMKKAEFIVHMAELASVGTPGKRLKKAVEKERGISYNGPIWFFDKAGMAQDGDKNKGMIANSVVDSFVRSLDEPHRMLVILKAQLYGGQWEPMLEDLRNRLEGKPYIFKLANRIKDDIERIGRLKTFEDENDVDLADYVKLES
ncbi:MAG: F0F1 ATP synthase subunit epsilon [Planctomycetota bacterium]